MKFTCKTFFDITSTGVTGHYKVSRVPFNDKFNQLIKDENTWNRARNQQRNLETIIQLISMRTQVSKLSDPIRTRDTWSFEFEVETPSTLGSEHNPVEVLVSDAEGVPMLTGLENNKNIKPMLVTNGTDQNVWFSKIL